MRREPSIRAVGTLLGALLALSVSGLGAQDPQARKPQQTADLQEAEKPAANLSDEEWGDLYMVRKEYDKAIDEYAHAIKLQEASAQNEKKLAVLWNKTGICYQQKMDYGHARESYRKAFRLDRAYAQPWNNMGSTYYLAGKPKKSIKFYRHAIKMAPEVASFHLNLGTAYFARKKYEQATREYRAAIQLDPEVLTRNPESQGTTVETRYANAKFYFYMAKIFASVGEPDKAVRYLERAMEEGFNSQKRILEDPDIQKISKYPAFITLMKNPPVAIKE
ncbi:MAG TPA: tetratricopeptide repeat protein [Terriglobia bacterium]|nr:tetratricopeptide repeat protein [Terriglobia bacterium]